MASIKTHAMGEIKAITNILEQLTDDAIDDDGRVNKYTECLQLFKEIEDIKKRLGEMQNNDRKRP